MADTRFKLCKFTTEPRRYYSGTNNTNIFNRLFC